MPYSSYLNSALNKEAFGATDFTAPGTTYVGLSTSTPAQDGTNVSEPSGGNYSRVSVTNNTTNWTPTAAQPGDGGQQQENGALIQFPTASAEWGTLTHFVIYDASTGGNLLAFGALDDNRFVVNGDSVSFPAGTLKIKLD